MLQGDPLDPDLPETSPDTNCNNIYSNNHPIANAESLECDMNQLLGGGAFYTIYVQSNETVDTQCLTLNNRASVYDPVPQFDEWDLLGEPDVFGEAELRVGFCEGRMTGGGSIFTTNILPETRTTKKGGDTFRVTHGFQIRCDKNDPPAESRGQLAEPEWEPEQLPPDHDD